MTPIERKIYDLLKSNPRVKLLVRNLYQGIFDLLPRQHETLPPGTRTFPYCFLGFHDIQPFSDDNSMLLAQRTEQPLTLPRNGERLEVGYIDLSDDTFHPLATTSAWNFHKGARLQWISGKDGACSVSTEYEHHFGNARFIYNDRQGNTPISIIRNLNGQEIKRLPVPVDTVSPDGRFATTFSYERLERLMPGYGYLGITDDHTDDTTGLSLLDIEKNEVRLLVSVAELKCDAGDEYRDYAHFVTHTEFSKDARYISFLHRYVPLHDISRRVTRMGIYDLHTARHFFLDPPTMVSHYVWNSRNEIIAYCGLDGIDSHVLFHIDNGRCVSQRHIAASTLNSDGHQTFLNDDIFVTDTYPDRRRMSKLYLVDTRCLVQTEHAPSLRDVYCGETEHAPSLLASIYSPKSYQTRDQHNHIACDLHPRASADGRWLCVDTPRTGIRSLCVMPLAYEKKISVIIPSYNPKDYLWACLRSITTQTLDNSLFEVIIVLNGWVETEHAPSCNIRTDILKYINSEMQEMDVRLIVTPTPGVGNARNIGLDNARGEYIAFIDDDDYISPTYLEELLQHASHDTIALSNTIAFNDHNPHLPFRITDEFLRCHLAGRQPFTRPKKYISGPCMKLIPRAIIAGRRFDTTLRNGEDSLFSFTISDRMRYADFTSPSAIYYRRVRSSGAQFSVTRRMQFRNALRLTARYTSIYIKSPRRYSLRFYLSRLLGCIHVVIKGPKGI